MADKKLPETLILGIGNILLSDDGLGVAAIEYLRTHYLFPQNIKLLDGGTRGLMLIGEILECDFLVVLDIMLGGSEPGTFYLAEENEIPESVNFPHTMHQANLADILCSCELAGKRPHAIVIGMEPFDYSTIQAKPSVAAQKLLPDFCHKAVAELVRRGFDIRVKS